MYSGEYSLQIENWKICKYKQKYFDDESSDIWYLFEYIYILDEKWL